MSSMYHGLHQACHEKLMKWHMYYVHTSKILKINHSVYVIFEFANMCWVWRKVTGKLINSFASFQEPFIQGQNLSKHISHIKHYILKHLYVQTVLIKKKQTNTVNNFC